MVSFSFIMIHNIPDFCRGLVSFSFFFFLFDNLYIDVLAINIIDTLSCQVPPTTNIRRKITNTINGSRKFWFPHYISKYMLPIATCIVIVMFSLKQICLRLYSTDPFNCLSDTKIHYWFYVKWRVLFIFCRCEIFIGMMDGTSRRRKKNPQVMIIQVWVQHLRLIYQITRSRCLLILPHQQCCSRRMTEWI